MKNFLIALLLIGSTGCTQAQGDAWKKGLAITGMVVGAGLAGMAAGMQQNAQNNRQYSIQPNPYSISRATITTTSPNRSTVQYEGRTYYCYENGNYVSCENSWGTSSCYTYGNSIYCK